MRDASEIGKAIIDSELTNSLLGPAAKATGQNMSLRAREKRVRLWDREKKVIDAETARQVYFLEQQNKLNEVERLLAQKLEHVAPENIVDPEVYVAAPALQAISYSMDSEDLREMYAELLSKSMQTSFKDSVHPSYVEIIKQLCPDEAKLLRYMNARADGIVAVFPAISIMLKPENPTPGIIPFAYCWSSLGFLAQCEQAENIVVFLDNFERLGLINRSDVQHLLNDSLYTPLFEHHIVTAMKNSYTMDDCFCGDTKKGMLELTKFGLAFCKTCISPPPVVVTHI